MRRATGGMAAWRPATSHRERRAGPCPEKHWNIRPHPFDESADSHPVGGRPRRRRAGARLARRHRLPRARRSGGGPDLLRVGGDAARAGERRRIAGLPRCAWRRSWCASSSASRPAGCSARSPRRSPILGCARLAARAGALVCVRRRLRGGIGGHAGTVARRRPRRAAGHLLSVRRGVGDRRARLFRRPRRRRPEARPGDLAGQDLERRDRRCGRRPCRRRCCLRRSPAGAARGRRRWRWRLPSSASSATCSNRSSSAVRASRIPAISFPVTAA